MGFECKKCGSTEHYLINHRDKRRGRDAVTVRPRCKPCSLKDSKWRMKKRKGAVRDAAFERFGPRCSCCGVVDREFLTLEHKNGGGRNDRRKRSDIAIWKDAAFSPDAADRFEILCYNCNCSRGFLGYCPCQRTRQQKVS
jgi:hypothetical protein